MHRKDDSKKYRLPIDMLVGKMSHLTSSQERDILLAESGWTMEEYINKLIELAQEQLKKYNDGKKRD